MARIGIIGGFSRSQSPNADYQLCTNLYLEPLESGQGKSAAALYCTPGLNNLRATGNGQGRGTITAQGRTFTVSGTYLEEVTGDGTSGVSIGQIASDGKPVSMVSGPNQVVIVSAGIMYVLSLKDYSITPIGQATPGSEFGLIGVPAQVSYNKASFVCSFVDSNQLQTSELFDATKWPTINAAAVEVFSDNISAIFTDHQLLAVFGPKAMQLYFNSGNFPFTFDVIDGGYVEQGLAAPFSIVSADNSIFFLGADSRGAGMVWRMNGYTPQRVSTFALETELAKYPTLTDAVCFAYQDQGHTFYVMNFPSGDATWVYDCATQLWHRRAYWDQQAGKFRRSLAGFHTFNAGMNKHLVLDPTAPVLYEQSINFLTDAGNKIRRVRTSPHIANEQEWIFHESLQLDLEVGLGPIPPFQGAAVPTNLPMLDTSGSLRSFQVAENGILQAPLFPTGDISLAQNLFINDQKNLTSWQITIDATGAITPVKLALFHAEYQRAMRFVSVLGDELWNFSLVDLGGGIAILRVDALGPVGRGAQVMIRWSDDGGHTWSNERTMDCGQAGEYTKRAIIRRLGRSRDRVYEISMTDAVPWRIIDAYLFTSEDSAPTPRFATEARKRA